MTSSLGGSTVPTPPVQTFTFPGMAGAATSTLDDISSGLGQFSGALSDIFNTIGAQVGGIGPSLSNFAPEAVNTAQGLIPQSTAFGEQGINLGSGLMGAGGGLLSLLGPLLGQAFDPQGALEQRTASSLQDRTLANLANAGQATTPYGQSVLGNTMSNFGIDWQNNLLGRMLQGITGAQNIFGAASGAEQSGQALGTSGLNTILQGAQAPFQAMANVGQGMMQPLLQWLGSGASAMAPIQTQIGDLLSFLSGGTNQIQANNQANLGAANFAANQNQQQFQNTAAAAGGLGSAFGGLFGRNGAFGGGGAFGPSGSFSSLVPSLGKAAAAA